MHIVQIFPVFILIHVAQEECVKGRPIYVIFSRL